MRKILALSVGAFAVGMDAYIAAPLVVPIAGALNTSGPTIAYGVSLFTLCYALSAPLAAVMLANRSARQTLVAGLVIFAISNLISGAATSAEVFLLSRAIAGIGAGIFAPNACAAATTLAPVERKGAALAVITAGISLGTVVGVPLGLMLTDKFGWRWVFVLIATIGIVGAGCIWAVIQICRYKQLPLKERIVTLCNPKVLRIVAVSFLGAAAGIGLYTLLALVLANYPQDLIQRCFWFWGIGGLIGAFSIGRIVDVLRNPSLLVLLFLIVTAAIFLILPTSDMHRGIAVLSGTLLWGFVAWSFHTPQQYLLVKAVPDSQAAAVSLNSSANYLGGALGAALGASLVEHGVDPSVLPFFAAGVLGFAILLQISNCVVIRSKAETSMTRANADLV